MNLIGLALREYIGLIQIGVSLFVDYVTVGILKMKSMQVICPRYEEIRLDHNIDVEKFYSLLQLVYFDLVVIVLVVLALARDLTLGYFFLFVVFFLVLFFNLLTLWIPELDQIPFTLSPRSKYYLSLTSLLSFLRSLFLPPLPPSHSLEVTCIQRHIPSSYLHIPNTLAFRNFV